MSFSYQLISLQVFQFRMAEIGEVKKLFNWTFLGYLTLNDGKTFDYMSRTEKTGPAQVFTHLTERVKGRLVKRMASSFTTNWTTTKYFHCCLVYINTG